MRRVLLLSVVAIVAVLMCRGRWSPAADLASRDESVVIALQYDLYLVEGNRVSDASGKKHNGTMRNGEIVLGRNKNAVRLDGRGSITMSDVPDTLDPESRPLTVGALCRPAVADAVIVSMGDKTNGFSLFLEKGVPHFAVRSNGELSQVVGDDPVPMDQWVHLAGAIDAQGKLRLIVNAWPVAEAAGKLIGQRPTEPFCTARTSGHRSVITRRLSTGAAFSRMSDCTGGPSIVPNTATTGRTGRIFPSVAAETDRSPGHTTARESNRAREWRPVRTMDRSDDHFGSQNSADVGNERLNRAIAEYLAAAQGDRTPDRQEFLEQYPDLANELTLFFSNYDRMLAVVSGVEMSALPPSQMGDDSDTLPPGRTSLESMLNGPSAPGAPDAARAHRIDASKLPSSNVAYESPQAGLPVCRFDDYELLEEIARGGMGVVYKAHQLSLNRIVAIKMILAGQLASAEDVRRFRTEAEAAANLDHPAIVPIYEVGHYAGQHYFSMGFVDGQSLAEKMKRDTYSPDEAARLVEDVAEAVQFAHENGVIHRDLKPANILIDRQDEPRITDFGLAKRVGVESDLTATGVILGTPGYMSPEQASGAKQIGPAADVYSLGAILFALLTGEPPFRAGTDLDTLLEVLEKEPTSPRQLNRAVDRNLETICLKCLEKDPGRRYGSARELADDLQRHLNGEAILARPIGLTGRLRRWARHSPALAATLVVLSLFYVNHMFAYYVLKAPGETREFHVLVTALVLVWGSSAAVFQFLTRRPGAGATTIYGWAGMDVLLFTCLLAVADGPRSTILFGYLLLVAGATLRFRVGLVWYVTGLCLSAYLLLVAEAYWRRPHLLPPAKGVLPFLLGLMTMGLIGGILLGRIRKLSSSESSSETQRRSRTRSARRLRL